MERYLYAQNVSRQAFAPRLALRCLRHLLKDVAIEGSEDSHWREHIFQIVAEGFTSYR